MILKNFLANPKKVGAIRSSSKILARAMASAITPSMRVVEIGAGTGALTEAIIGKNVPKHSLTIFEIDPSMCRMLKRKFPGYRIICDDVKNCGRYIKPHSVDLVISGLPLRNFSPQEQEVIMKNLLKILKHDGHILQFTYGWKSPISHASLGLEAERLRYILWNVPPAMIWKFSKSM